MAPAYNLFGPLDAVLGSVQIIEYVLLVLIVINMITRIVAHRRHVSQADEGGAEAMTRHPIHVASNVLLVLGTFYYTTLHQHSGIVTSTLVLGLFLTDFFEFEARKVEARREIDLDTPKGAIAASVLALLYIGYLSAFQFIAPIWNAVI